MILTFLAGMALTLAAAFLGLREISLGEKVRTLPDAPFWVRTCMFVFMVVLAFRGAELLLSCSDRRPIHVDLSGVVVAAIMATYHFAMLYNVFRQRYPAHVWDRLKRMEKLASCGRNGWVLVVLKALGWEVWAPREGVLPDNRI